MHLLRACCLGRTPPPPQPSHQPTRTLTGIGYGDARILHRHIHPGHGQSGTCLERSRLGQRSTPRHIIPLGRIFVIPMRREGDRSPGSVAARPQASLDRCPLLSWTILSNQSTALNACSSDGSWQFPCRASSASTGEPFGKTRRASPRVTWQTYAPRRCIPSIEYQAVNCLMYVPRNGFPSSPDYTPGHPFAALPVVARYSREDTAGLFHRSPGSIRERTRMARSYRVVETNPATAQAVSPTMLRQIPIR